MLRRSHFQRTREGDYKVRLSDDERTLIGGLADSLGELLEGSETAEGAREGLVRLFPPAYLEERELDKEYQRLMRTELVSRRLEAIELMRSTASADRLSDEELNAWMRAMNDARLILGTVLDVSEDTDPMDAPPDAPDFKQRMVYVILSAMVDEAVDALSGGLP